MIEEEWYCIRCGGYFDQLAEDEGFTCAFCGSNKIHVIDDHGGVIMEPKCFMTDASNEKCDCLLFNICEKYKGSINKHKKRT